jgi:hypothetical protein
MAVEIPIISEFDGKGVKKAIKEFQQLEGAGAKANFALKKAAMASTVAFAGLAAGISLATKAAMEDAQAQTQLATALKNTTGATDAQIASSEQYISTLSRATGVADDQLRPALAALVRGTKDINQAQTTLNLATDISIATNRDLVQVSEALAMAYAGNMRGLRSLSPEMAALIKEGASLDEVMRVLAQTFGGAAAANAETAAGKMQIFRNSMNEATESLGAAFLPVLESILPVIQRFADWAGKNTETLVGLTYAIGITTAAVIALNFAMSINPWVLAVTYTLLATTALFKFSDALKNSESMVGRLIYKLRYLIAPLLAVIDAYNAIARITGLPQLTPDSISLPGIPSAAPTLGPPAAVTGGANRLVPSLPSIPSISPAGVSGSRSGGRSGGMALSDGGGSGPSAASLGLALDLSNYQPPADFLAGYDPFAGMGFTINVNGGLATSAEIGNAVVDAIKQYTNVSGPADIAIR